VAALAACLADAREQSPDVTAFLGDSLGCCGHSEEIVRMVREHAGVLVAGNHEQEAAKDSESCGCGYASPEDEAVSCEAFRLATASLLPETRAWLGTWSDRAIVELEGGRVLLCHGSPGQTAEFLYEAELDDLRLEAWLDKFDARGFVCTHSGLPWIRRLPERDVVASRANRLASKPPPWLTVERAAFVESIEVQPDGATRARISGGRGADVDELVWLTGYRPDLVPLSELPLELSPASEGALRLQRALGNVTDCLSVPKVKPGDLASGEPRFHLIGAKSYGRARTFLLQTGYAQLETILDTLFATYEQSYCVCPRRAGDGTGKLWWRRS
jgi:hypothetical protein